MTQDSNGVEALLKTASGETQTIQAQYLVGCDGSRSSTRHRLDLSFVGSTNPRLFYVADVEMELQADRSTVQVAFGADSYVIVVPMQGEKQWRLIGNLPEYNDQPDSDPDYQEVENKVKKLVQQPLDITQVKWFSTYKVHTRHAEAFSKGRCFLAGDAAHVHTPAGGQGMNTGIQDAYNLAWKLSFVLKGWARDSLLDTYEEERLTNAKHLLKTTDQLFEIQASGQWWLSFLRNHVLLSLAGFMMQFNPVRETVFTMLSETGVNYRDRSLSQHQQDAHETQSIERKFKVEAGERLPYFLVDGVSVYDKLRAPSFHLLAFSRNKDDYDQLRSDLEAKYGSWTNFQAIPIDASVAKIFGADQPFMVLLRPDNYIGMIAPKLSLRELSLYFNP